MRIAVSTVAEIEFLLPTLLDWRNTRQSVNILYGVPLPISQVDRLSILGRKLGPGSISLMVDHPSHLAPLHRFRETAGHPCSVFLKIDTGYHRAGLPPTSLNKDGLVEAIAQLEADGVVHLAGLYSHSSLSYSGTTSANAMDALASEIDGCLSALQHHREHLSRTNTLIISVGASPQVTAIKNFAGQARPRMSQRLQDVLQKVSQARLDNIDITLELHAGVYSVMDMQQLSTCSVDEQGSVEDEIALSVVAEVVSVYNNGERQQPEGLVAVGTLGLGREPCSSYKGWAVASCLQKPWVAACKRRLIVERISQEHSVVSWEAGPVDDPANPPMIPLEVGDTVRLYPNHACVTGAMYNHYLVVDSDTATPTEIRDVWLRASGW